MIPALALFGESARGRTPKQIVWRPLSGKYPEATLSYEIPTPRSVTNRATARLADVYARDSAASYTRLRVIVMAAVKHDYALIAAAVGRTTSSVRTTGTVSRRGQPRTGHGHRQVRQQLSVGWRLLRPPT